LKVSNVAEAFDSGRDIFHILNEQGLAEVTLSNLVLDLKQLRGLSRPIWKQPIIKVSRLMCSQYFVTWQPSDHFFSKLKARGGEIVMNMFTSRPDDEFNNVVRNFVHTVVYGDLLLICPREDSIILAGLY